ncbi:MAG: hypothetical protein ACOYXW_18985, partial [Actinomycetota bacterium]
SFALIHYDVAQARRNPIFTHPGRPARAMTRSGGVLGAVTTPLSMDPVSRTSVLRITRHRCRPDDRDVA